MAHGAMGKLLNIVTPLHKKTKRDYLARMTDDKVHCMVTARKYGFDYWDGDRRYGYGGYQYDGRWKPVAEGLIDIYDLKSDAKILDIGCGKAHLLYELKKILSAAEIRGFDISHYAIRNAPEEIKNSLLQHRTQDAFPFEDRYFDLAVSLNCFHNLCFFDLKNALAETERVAKNKYVSVESYRNEQEQFNLQCWALTAQSFFNTFEWIWLFNHFGYTGDYEFIFFE